MFEERIAAMNQRTEEAMATNAVQFDKRTYRREYKKRFAWTKSGKILPEELYAWGERAREKKAECDSGKITLEEYTTWLKES